MSVEKDSSIESSHVFVRLLGEGTLVYRPSPAKFLSERTARLIAPSNYDPEDEDWEFKPGSIVRVELRRLGEVEDYIAVKLASEEV